MASKIDVSALTLNAKEADEVSKAVIELAFVMSDLGLIHTIQTGISMKEQIVFVDNLDVGGNPLTDCVPVEQDGLVMTEKFWDPELIAGRFTHCANDLNQLLKIFARAKKANPDYFDRIGSEEMGLLMAKIAEAITVSVFAKAWLGDKAAAVQPGGNFTIAGFDATLWNQFDGIWKQVFADAAIPRYTIAENAGVTYLLQELAAGKANTMLRAMYKNADPRLRGHADVQIVLTDSLWQNYFDYLEDTQKTGGITEVLEDGRTVLKYRGINVINEAEWDRTIRKYQDDLTVHFRPHRAIMTIPDNIPIGTLSEEDLENLKSFYFEKGLENIVDYAYFLDAKFGEAYMASVAY